MTPIDDISLFKDLTCREKEDLSRRLKQAFYKRGEILFSEGEECRHVFIIDHGRVKITRCSEDGREQILEVLKDGDSCACHPGCLPWHCQATAEALTDVSVWRMSRRDYSEMVQHNSRLSKALNEIFAKRLCHFSRLISTLSLDPPEKRIIRLLLHISSLERDDCGHDTCDCVLLTQEEIARRLGLVRVTVTRRLHQLKERGLIRQHQNKRLEILDRAGLQAMLEQTGASRR